MNDNFFENGLYVYQNKKICLNGYDDTANYITYDGSDLIINADNVDFSNSITVANDILLKDLLRFEDIASNSIYFKNDPNFYIKTGPYSDIMVSHNLKLESDLILDAGNHITLSNNNSNKIYWDGQWCFTTSDIKFIANLTGIYWNASSRIYYSTGDTQILFEGECHFDQKIIEDGCLYKNNNYDELKKINKDYTNYNNLSKVNYDENFIKHDYEKLYESSAKIFMNNKKNGLISSHINDINAQLIAHLCEKIEALENKINKFDKLNNILK